MKALIFAAGLGTRLRPLTDTMPKALVPMGGKSLLQWQVEKLLAAGIDDITVNVHHFADQIIEAVNRNQGWGAHITISDERDQLLDTGGALYKVLSSFTHHPSPILICNVDILSNIAISHLLAYPDHLVVSDRQTQRYLCFDPDGYLCGWTNRQTGEFRGQDGQQLAYGGMAVLTPAIWPLVQEVYKEKGPVFSIIDVYWKAMGKRLLKAYVPNAYRMMDVGKIEHLNEAERFALSLNP